MSDKSDLVAFFKSQQEKYTYYVIALAVASLGFSVNLTMDMKISKAMIPLGIALICWLVSVYSGLRMLQWVMSSTYANINLLEVIEGNHELTGRNPQAIKIASDTIRNILEDNSKTTVKLGTNRDISFYSGIAFFILWRIIEMA
jgi:hypothetical protein